MLTRQILLQHERVFKQPISRIYYCYTNFQESFKEIKNRLGNKVVFVEGFSGQSFFSEQGISDRTEESKAIIIVLDDCMLSSNVQFRNITNLIGLEELLKQKDSLTVFTRDLHHKNCAIILQTQVLLVNSDLYRSIVKVSFKNNNKDLVTSSFQQSSAIVSFYSLRARQGLKNLSVQLFDRAQFLPSVSSDILKTCGQYRPLIIDLRNGCPEGVRVRSGIIGIDDEILVYQP